MIKVPTFLNYTKLSGQFFFVPSVKLIDDSVVWLTSKSIKKIWFSKNHLIIQCTRSWKFEAVPPFWPIKCKQDFTDSSLGQYQWIFVLPLMVSLAQILQRGNRVLHSIKFYIPKHALLQESKFVSTHKHEVE